jgi:plasmid stability protein
MAVLYIRDLDDQLHREIKSIAALKGKSLQDLIVYLIKKEIEKNQCQNK